MSGDQNTQTNDEQRLLNAELLVDHWQGRYYAVEGKLEQLTNDLRELWNNRGEDINVSVAKLLVKHGIEVQQ
jgi:hypothetical protein